MTDIFSIGDAFYSHTQPAVFISESFLKFLLQAFSFTQYPLHTTNLSLQAFSSLHMPKKTLPLSKNSSIVLLAYSTFPICPKQLSPPHTSLHSSPSPSTLPIYPSPFTNLLLISRKLFPLPSLKHSQIL